LEEGEQLNVNIVKTLLNLGYEVSIAVLYQFNPKDLQKLFGVSTENVKVYALFSKPISFLGVYQKLLLSTNC